MLIGASRFVEISIEATDIDTARRALEEAV